MLAPETIIALSVGLVVGLLVGYLFCNAQVDTATNATRQAEHKASLTQLALQRAERNLENERAFQKRMYESYSVEFNRMATAIEKLSNPEMVSLPGGTKYSRIEAKKDELKTVA
ncbi:MAG TPA: hypothetical protein VEF04_04585 [Blastocatellia bacterium]|nr:hypothetical protein [Blastocatellia bacterium]